MPRPRFVIGPDDWFDTLDWLDHQLSQPTWLLDEQHPIHRLGLATFQDRVRQCRYASQPTHPDCQALQSLLTDSLTRPDWDRLRKTLSARRRRRRERRLDQSPVNLTLTPAAHHWLKNLAEAGGFATLSQALEESLPQLVAEHEASNQQTRQQRIEEQLAGWPRSWLLAVIERYLDRASRERSLATACRIAYQWFQREPDRHKESLLKERFIEDLVWNETHLKRPAVDFLEGGP
ncbi:hypothetical protein [Saccharospirillum salsuginis]|uniref:Uncharacterized protein n=1 Tax=Saccharospirillum salsuginis TaxID=418750 RepID=A0A918N9W4_9GAMM|nr:hypothetical protein [Saccharospirillum salsuginis]GGX52097.1 hypothetical protein GCM10007392_19280 [Saccharospirillum salsuginis]